MVSVTTVDGKEIQQTREAGRHAIQVLGSEITFSYLPESPALYVTASISTDLSHPYLENWLSEPLRILVGQLIYPRFVARNFGNRRAVVSIRPSPLRIQYAGLASLLGEDPVIADSRFWETYATLLALIARARDQHGHPNFQNHRLTQFYEEIVQSTKGSRWVQCLTLASSAEGIAKMLVRPAERQSDFSREDIANLKKVVASWDGDEELRKRVVAEIERTSQRTIARIPARPGWAFRSIRGRISRLDRRSTSSHARQFSVAVGERDRGQAPVQPCEPRAWPDSRANSSRD